MPNPPFHPEGDFALDAAGRVQRDGGERRWTYANLALCRAGIVADVAPRARAALGPLLFDAARAEWHNIGTPQQLVAI